MPWSVWKEGGRDFLKKRGEPRHCRLLQYFNFYEIYPTPADCKTALVCSCAKQVVPYLTAQFYAQDYSVAQRLDMLEALARAAEQLSSAQPAPVKAPAEEQPTRTMAQPAAEAMKARLEARTRRFHLSRKPYADATLTSSNKFAPLASLFFFPLLADFDRKLQAMVALVSHDQEWSLGEKGWGAVAFGSVGQTALAGQWNRLWPK